MKNSSSNSLRIVFFPLLLTLSLFLAGCAATTKPVTSKDTMQAWANEALLATFTYDYAHYPQQLRRASHYYTTEGWKNYASALEASGNLQAIVNKKMIASAIPQGTPKVLSKAGTKAQAAWKIEIPMLLIYQNAHTNLKQSVIVTLVVLKTNGQSGVRGLAIDQLIVQSAIKEKKVTKRTVTNKPTAIARKNT